MRIDNLEALYIEQLKDLHNAEKQYGEGVSRLAGRARSEGLRTYLRSEVEATDRQRKKLEGLFDGLDARPTGERCEGMAGLVKELDHLADSCETPEARDAAIVAGLQRIKHYEIAGYGCARTFAERLDRSDEADRLQEILDDEAKGDRALTNLATDSINELAAEVALA